MNKKILILGFNGSPHKDGVVAKLLKSALQGARRAGAQVELIHLYDMHIERESGIYSKDPKKANVKNLPKDDFRVLVPRIIKADGLIFATPNYWANMSAVMKGLVERLTVLENDGFRLRGKIAAFIAASKENEGGLEMAAMSMVSALGQMGVLILPNGIMWHPGGKWTTLNHKAHESKSWAQEDAPLVGRNMVALAELLKDNPIKW
ncbi:MAG: flavodoxin family protein [Candidatus Doudnabacteria bacterium]|nr:flavodoxin family protein [Candidatus Doudnabacteria bacterium]